MPSDQTTRDSCLAGGIHRELDTITTIIQVEARELRWHDERALDASSNYKFSQRLAGVKIVVFRGEDIRSGQTVLLHQLTRANDHTQVLQRALQYVAKKPVSAGGQILDLVEIRGEQFVVTADQPECLSLLEWLEWELQIPKPASSTVPATPASQPGEFTRLFQQSEPGAPPSAPTPPQSGPGEFTQLFQPGAQPRSPDPAAPVAPMAVSAPTPLAAESQPGEFTKLFRSPLAPAAQGSRDPLPIGPPSRNAPGEFTRIFGSGPPTQVPAPFSSQPSAAVPPPPPAEGQLTESLENRRPPASAPVAANPPVGSGPSEFTRVISGPALPSAQAPAAAPQAPVAPAAMPITPAASPPTFQSVPAPPTYAAAAMLSSHAGPPPAPTYAPPPIPALSSAPPRAEAPSQALFVFFAILIVAAVALILFVVFRK